MVVTRVYKQGAKGGKQRKMSRPKTAGCQGHMCLKSAQGDELRSDSLDAWHPEISGTRGPVAATAELPTENGSVQSARQREAQEATGLMLPTSKEGQPDGQWAALMAREGHGLESEEVPRGSRQALLADGGPAVEKGNVIGRAVPAVIEDM